MSGVTLSHYRSCYNPHPIDDAPPPGADLEFAVVIEYVVRQARLGRTVVFHAVLSDFLDVYLVENMPRYKPAARKISTIIKYIKDNIHWHRNLLKSVVERSNERWNREERNYRCSVI